MGEFTDAVSARREAQLFGLISSCNVACGGHTGNRETMAQTFALAKTHNVICGAHPSYPDRDGFGRRSIALSPSALCDTITEQLDNCFFSANEANVTLHHLKPHGMLYNDAAADHKLAMLLTDIALNHDVALVGPPGSAMETAALTRGVRFVGEGFIDRQYQINGALTPRSQAGAVIADIETRVSQGLALARGERLRLKTGSLSLGVQTLCIHSDSQGALETAAFMVNALRDNGIKICPVFVEQ